MGCQRRMVPRFEKEEDNDFRYVPDPLLMGRRGVPQRDDADRRRHISPRSHLTAVRGQETPGTGSKIH